MNAFMRVRTVRLLPVVVVAASALLGLKVIGLATSGGYALAGVAHAAGAPAGGEGASGAVGTATIGTGPTLGDTAPVASDASPTSMAANGVEAGDEPQIEGAPARAVDPVSQLTAQYELGAACPTLDGAEAAAAASRRIVGIDCTQQGDAIARIVDADGVPVVVGTNASGAMTEQALLERLAERRGDLEVYAEELAMRTALVEAAERRIEERAAAMEALEAQVASLVEQREAAQTELVAGVVAMYATMRPRDAATIFNELDMTVLGPIAKAMAPRKMAPILAAMNPVRAQELTVYLAASGGANSAGLATTTDLDALPQIVGQ